jgi:hypothetical protein
MNVKQILFEEQRGRCATCEDEAEIKKLVVDHCYRTGYIRGLLCVSCNSREGKGYQHPAFVEYRAHPPGQNRWQYGEHLGPRIAARVPKQSERRIRELALDEDCTVQELIVRGLSALFVQRGLEPLDEAGRPE